MEDLLNPRHPLDKYHQAPLDFLAALSEAQHAYHVRLFRLGNAGYRYQQQADRAVTEDDFHHWLEGLPEKMWAAMVRDGFEASRTCRCGGTRWSAATWGTTRFCRPSSHRRTRLISKHWPSHLPGALK